MPEIIKKVMSIRIDGVTLVLVSLLVMFWFSCGRHKWFNNASTGTMTISNNSGFSSAGNRILTPTGADITGVTVAHIIYSALASAWILMDWQ